MVQHKYTSLPSSVGVTLYVQVRRILALSCAITMAYSENAAVIIWQNLQCQQ